MKAVKFLERKGVIRLFGLGLFVAPFINALMLIQMEKSKYAAYVHQISYIQILKSGTPFHYFLALCSIGIGLTMLVTGSQKAWKLVLALLSIHIVIQFKNLGVNIKQSWLWGAFFIVNLGAFVFIAEQLVFKDDVDNQTSPTIQNDTLKTRKKMSKTPIGFKDYGYWGELAELNFQGITVKKIKEPPSDIQNRTIRVKFKDSVDLSARFSHFSDDVYHFRFTDMNNEDKRQLYSWIQKHAS